MAKIIIKKRAKKKKGKAKFILKKNTVHSVSVNKKTGEVSEYKYKSSKISPIR